MPIRVNSSKHGQSAGEVLRERELADRWKTSMRTLQRWRSEGSGPAYIKIGRSIRYRLCDIETFEERGRDEGAAMRSEGE